MGGPSWQPVPMRARRVHADVASDWGWESRSRMKEGGDTVDTTARWANGTVVTT